MPLGQLPFPTPGWRDLLEILIVAYVVYALLRFLVGTRALQIVFGLLVLAVIYLVAFLLKLSHDHLPARRGLHLRRLRRAGGVPARAAAGARAAGADAGLPAVRRGGRHRRWPRRSPQAVERLSRSATGAIIAVEREVRLDEYLESGTPMRATVSADLLATIFSPYSPLHDGAVLVRGDEIVGAGCILPAHAESGQRPVARHAASRGARSLGGDRRAGARWSPRSPRSSRSPAAGTLQRALTPEQVLGHADGTAGRRGRRPAS